MDKFTKHIVLLVFQITALSLSDAIAQELSSKISSSEIKIGAQASLYITLKGNDLNKVKWFNFSDSLSSVIEVVESSKIDTQITNNNTFSLSQTVYFTCFDTGIFSIEPQSCYYDNKALQTNSFTIMVSSIAVDTTKGITDIKAPIEVSVSLLDYLKIYKKYILVGWAILTLLTLLLILIIQRYLKNKPLKNNTPIIQTDPYQEALDELDRIEKNAIWKQQKHKKYYTSITDTIINYLANAHQLFCHEKTSAEIYLFLSHSKLKDHIPSLKELFDTADLVKFAKLKPIEAQNMRAIELAKHIVIETKPASQEDTEDKGTDNQKTGNQS